MKETIKTALIDFICEHCGGHLAREDVVDTLDEIILNYVVTVLEDVLDLKKRNKTTEEFDVTEFSEMLSGYFPLFGDIPGEVVLEWVERLVTGLMGAPQEPRTILDTAWISSQDSTTEEPDLSKFSSVLNIASTTTTTNSRTSSVSTDFDDELDEEDASRRRRCNSHTDTLTNSPHLATLSEMFPNYSQSDLGMVLNLANHDLQRAVQILLLDAGEEEGGIVKELVSKSKRIGSTGSNGSSSSIGGGKAIDDKKGLKERLMARYGFIDKSEDAREFRPILPKEEPKKLVRYRGGQVVSTKGERFTEVAVTSTGEEVKLRSYLSRSQRQAIAEGRGNN